jgi:hypothetical protein
MESWDAVETVARIRRGEVLALEKNPAVRA